MSDDQFTKLFKYIEDFRKEVNLRFDEKASQTSVDRLTNTVDGIAMRLDDKDIEDAAHESQFSKLVNWSHKTAKITGVPLRICSVIC